jgi:hypothetical protein
MVKSKPEKAKQAKARRAANNRKYNQSQREKGYEPVTVWCPSYCKVELQELMSIIGEFHEEKGEFHKKLFPAMYREFSTGKMGNKSLNDIKLIAAKEAVKSRESQKRN